MTQPYVPPSPYPSPGEVVGESWVVEKVLGQGGMGCVARAYHAVLHTPVALKFMNPQFMIFPGAVERFINEGKASGRIKSDHVVPVMDARKLPSGAPYLVMECLDGLDLDALLARDGRAALPAERAVHFVVQILRGLQAAHAIGVVHRDMKPSNCFVVNKDGEDDFVKILDFGISKIGQDGGPSLTRTNSTLGTPLYMSPEQAKSPRDVDARSDLYSTGAILYELLAGRAPFFSEGVELLEILVKLVTAEPPPVKSLRPDLPDALAAVVHKALAREPADRYSSALEMAEALAPFAPARSAHVLGRMRAFRPPSPAPARPGLPPSLDAFSRLERPGATGAAATSPLAGTMDVPASELFDVPASEPSDTELMPPALPQHAPAGTLVMPETAAALARAPAIEAPPRSQARPSSRRGAARRSPLVYALPVAAGFGLLGAVAALSNRGEGDARGGASAPAAATAPPARAATTSPPARADATPPAPPPGPAASGAAAGAPPATDLSALPAQSDLPPPPSAPAAKPPPRPAARPPRDPGFDPGIKH